MALALALVLALITISSMVVFAGQYWWFPVLASEHGGAIDEQIVWTFVLCGVIFFAAQIGLGWADLPLPRPGPADSLLSRQQPDGSGLDGSHHHHVHRDQPAGAEGLAERYFARAPRGALQIEVVGQQFVWNIRYPGPDGKFGRTDIHLVDDAAGNPLGLDDTDAAALDDIVVPTMAVPINRPVELILRSKDVTHSFFVRELRLKQDTVPGMVIPAHFTATRLGQYEIVCTELCGLGHYKMRSFLDVLSEQDYEKWLEERAVE